MLNGPTMAQTGSVNETVDEIAVIRIGEEAVDRITKTFDHWLEVARALEAGYRACLRATSPEPSKVTRGREGGAFAPTYSRWLAQHPKLDNLGDSPKSAKTIRYWLHKCLEDEVDIITWRKGQ